MSNLLNPGQKLHLEEGDLGECLVESFIKSGGQGEIYKVLYYNSDQNQPTPMALKWYWPEHIENHPRLRDRLKTVIQQETPSKDHFLWPEMLVVKSENDPGFGYIMKLREPRFKEMADLMKYTLIPKFRTLIRVGFELAYGYHQLHSKGLCYRDISFGNVAFDPDTGEIRICDNDNVDEDGSKGDIKGTSKFMAPEIVRGEATPCIDTDLHALAVLLFYIFMIDHPLEGKKDDLDVIGFDLDKLFAEPVFIFDPEDDSNRPVEGDHDNVLVFWEIYPQFLKDPFIQTFTEGLKNPKRRVRTLAWQQTMLRLYDSIIHCETCGLENFFDPERQSVTCWRCSEKLTPPPRLCIGEHIIMLNANAVILPHHINLSDQYVISKPVGKLIQHPKHPDLWGVKNLTSTQWVCTDATGKTKSVNPDSVFSLRAELKIDFGSAQGEIQA